MKYGHILSALTEHPWAITESKLAEIIALLEFRANGGVLTDEQVQARIGDGNRPLPQQHGAVAVVPMHGPIYPRANMMTEVSGGVSLDRLSGQMAALVADPSVVSIVLDIDSPGGSVVGVQELAEQMRAWRKQKPIIAVANHLMASAAYWIGANASEIVASKSSAVGSVGVYMTHKDESQALEKAGVKLRILSAGKHKAEGGSHEPLSADAEAFFMDRINEVYGWFVRDVAKGRNVAASVVRAGYGEGRAISAERALAAGMVDRLGTLDDVIREQASGMRPAGALRAEDVATAFDVPATLVEHAEGVSADTEAAAAADKRARWNIL